MVAARARNHTAEPLVQKPEPEKRRGRWCEGYLDNKRYRLPGEKKRSRANAAKFLALFNATPRKHEVGLVPDHVVPPEKTTTRLLADERTARRIRDCFAGHLDPDDLFGSTLQQNAIETLTRRLYFEGRPKVFGERLDNEGNPAGIPRCLFSTCFQAYSEFGRQTLRKDVRAWARRVWKRMSGKTDMREARLVKVRIRLPENSTTPRQDVNAVAEELMRALAANRCFRMRKCLRAAALSTAALGPASRLSLLVAPRDRDTHMEWFGPWIEDFVRTWLRDRGFGASVKVKAAPRRENWYGATNILFDGDPCRLDDEALVDYALAERGLGRRGKIRWWSPRGVLSPRTKRRRDRRYRIYDREQAVADMFGTPERHVMAEKAGELAHEITESFQAVPSSIGFLRFFAQWVREEPAKSRRLWKRIASCEEPVEQAIRCHAIAYAHCEVGKYVDLLMECSKLDFREYRKAMQLERLAAI